MTVMKKSLIPDKPRSGRKRHPDANGSGNGRLLVTVCADYGTVDVPGWVVDLPSFRRWYHSDDFPEEGRISFLNGEVIVDMSREQLFSHNQIKAEYTIVVGGLARMERRGRYFPDGARLTNVEANLSRVPDGLYVLNDSFATNRIRLVEGAEDGYTELEGTPDMALEVVSDSSVEKDTETLFELYWKAGIAEYWLVDARGDRLVFEIYHHTPKGYVATRKQNGWIKSQVFGKSFRLTRGQDAQGHPEFTLHVR
jgi:Uma2 family endonuclease